MRILLAHNSTYYPSQGGGDKSNRLLMEALARRGHDVRVFTRTERFDASAHEQFLHELDKRNQTYDVDTNGEVRFTLEGVDVRTLTSHSQLRAAFQAHIDDFRPDIIVTSTDDPGHLLFDLAVKAPHARVVYLVRATIAVPFGPDSSSVNAKKTEALRRADGVVGVSHYVAGYVRQWAGIDAVHVPISLLEPVADYPNLGSFDNRYVAMVNPCAVKGISIFLELARRMPDVAFAAIPTWGTQSDEMAAMRALPNVTLLPQVDDIDDLLKDTRVMLVPSVWAEARSRIVLESMSRGVPVLASDVGGLHEAKLGVPYLLPVNPIRHYRQSVDSSMVPVAEVPAQNVDPWVDVLERMVTDRAHWDEIAYRSREAALEYASNLNVLPFERVLTQLMERPKKGPAEPAHAAPSAQLSEAQKKLLALKLRQKTVQKAVWEGSLWFPGAEDSHPAAMRLFCFPWAGGGALGYVAWKDALRTVAQVCPVRLPGRETRASEPVIDSMDQFVATLAKEIQPFLDKPFAFFGHSMGAGIAFEVARALQRDGLAMPRRLFVSGARSPVFRLNHVAPPDPSRQEFIAELKRLEGFPPQILNDPRLMSLALPALEADSRMYRRYVYRPGDPLDIPVHAYAGTHDVNTQGEAMERWREVCTGEFTLEWFEGGHFYLEPRRDALIASVRDKLTRA